MNDDDCEYIENTGKCNTPEWVAKKYKEAEERGVTDIARVPHKDGISCSCENKACMTYQQGHLITNVQGTDEMFRQCASRSDCVSVGCSCNCSGCGGFSYEDVINKKYVDAWYEKEDCKPAQACPEVCCSPRTIECENKICVVKDKPNN